jgi:FtsP/CotA-like multicopper oxidase with cupredoxin domain
VTLQYPPFPLLLEPQLVKDSLFCNGHSLRQNAKCLNDFTVTVCKCTHLLRVKHNANVEFMVYNVRDNISHPVHLHGHKFQVLETGLIEDVNERSEIRPKTDFSRDKLAFKDTVLLPFPGYVRLRFRANNPGFWLFHCHFDWHITIGESCICMI